MDTVDRARFDALKAKAKEDMAVMNERLIAMDQTIMREGIKLAEANRKLKQCMDALKDLEVIAKSRGSALGLDNRGPVMDKVAAITQTKP